MLLPTAARRQGKPAKTTAMAKVRLTLNGLPDLELLAIGRKHERAMDDNPNFPDPVPDEAAFIAATDTWEGQIMAVQHALTAYREAIAAKAAGRTTYEGILRQRASHIDAASGGDAGKILSAGFDLRRDGQPVGTLPAPARLTAVMGDRPGQIRLRWKRVRGAAIYQAEFRRRDEPDDAWQPLGSPTAAKIWTVDLESGVEYAFRVAAIGTAGPSPWAGPLFRMAP